MHEIQVLVRRDGFALLLGGGATLVRGALQVELQMHSHRAREQIVHDYDADVLTRSLNTVQSVKLWEQGTFVLVQVLTEGREREGKKENKYR